MAGAVRIELTSAILETAVLTFERHPNIYAKTHQNINIALPLSYLRSLLKVGFEPTTSGLTGRIFLLKSLLFASLYGGQRGI